MSLLLGQALDGRELERETSAWSGERFAGMCDSLVWAASRQARTAPPSLTFNTNAPDGGVDAECVAELPAPPTGQATLLIGSGWNVFQYKKRDALASDRKKIVAGLKSLLKGALKQLEDRHGRKPDRYIACANINLDHAEKKALREAILDGFDRPAAFPEPIILGAQELAQLLNDNPHLRAAYFQPTDFRSWTAALEALGARKFLGKDVPLRGREELLAKARALIADPRVRVVVFWGPHDVGKSRLALEAARAGIDSVVVAADPQELAAGDLRALVSAHQQVLCIAEDPDPQQIGALIQETLSEPGLKLVLTVPIPSHAPKPAYGTDDRVQHLQVPPLSRQESRNLIGDIGPKLPFEIEDWIAEKSGGIPGVILAAASLGEGLREGAEDFRTRVGQEFSRRIQEHFGATGLQSVRLASILTQVGVTGKVAGEVPVLCELFGEELSAPALLKEAGRLCETGVLRRRGSYLEVAIPMLANFLAAEALTGKQNQAMALFARLEPPGRIRLLRRLGELDEQSNAWFWDSLFGTGGLFEGARLLDHSAAFEVVAGAAPEKALGALKSLLEGTPLELRAKIGGEHRRGLVHALEQLLFRRRTSREALRLMGLLAEAENETWANNATGVFAECFLPNHPQMPLPLTDRLAVLREFAGKPESASRRTALKAVDDGMPSGGGATTLRHAEGSTLFDPPPRMTYAELWDYMRALMEIGWNLAQGGDTVAAEARVELPGLATRLGLHAPPEFSLEWFQRLADMAVSDTPRLEVSAVSDALERVLEGVRKRMGKEGLSEAARSELTEAEKVLQSIVDRLEGSDFVVQVRRWLGKGFRFGRDEQEQKAIEALADEALAHPELLTDAIWEWLRSRDAQGASLFVTALGRKDSAGHFRATIEAQGAAAEGADIFSSYWYGWSHRDPDEQASAERRLDELAAGNALDGKSVVLATWKLSATEAGVARIIDQIRRGRAAGDWVAWIIVRGSWMEPLSSDQASRLFQAIAGEDNLNGSRVLDLIGMWIHLKKPLTGELEELAWRTLEADPQVTHNDAWDCDRVAAHLTDRTPARGFSLLEKLAVTERDGKWDPIESHAENKFWRTLCSLDRPKTLGVVIQAATNPRRKFELEWALKELLSPSVDREAILQFARQSVENARLLAGCLTAGADGFWRLASELMALYPQDDQLWYEIAGDIEGMNQVITGPHSGFLERRKEEVKKVIADPATTAPLRNRLQDWLARVEDRIGHHVTREYDEDIDGLMRHVRDKDSAQRVWAIGRILQNAPIEEVRKLLTAKDIEEALPSADLSEERRKVFEAAIQARNQAT